MNKKSYEIWNVYTNEKTYRVLENALQVLDLFKSYMELNQYKQCSTCKSLYLKHLHISLDR